MPRDIARGTLLPCYRLFVEGAHVLGPRFGARIERIAHTGHLGHVKICPAWGKAAGIGYLFWNDSIRADINVIERQAVLTRRRLHTPFRLGLHPPQIELAVA